MAREGVNAELARQRHEELIRDAERRALLGDIRRGQAIGVASSAARPLTIRLAASDDGEEPGGRLRGLATRLTRLLPAR